jgi:SAM-dependent methyltransferase
MSKRDDDSQPNEMEVGMTTAERRRRRRRGGGLRVPSDNVPRSRTPSAPPPPVPEDPALAMSIAYSFRGEESGPIPRPLTADPVAPDAMPTVIDPPSGPVDAQDFEVKTREMSSVDLQALGLEDPGAGSTLRMERASNPQMDTVVTVVEPRSSTDRTGEVDVDVNLDTDQPEMVTQPVASLAPDKKPSLSRHNTVALSEDDLEEVRAHTNQARATTAPAAAPPATTKPPPMAPSTTKPPPLAPGLGAKDGAANRTQPIASGELEIVDKKPISEPMSVPEIDIQDLAERAAESDEISIDVDDDKAKEAPVATAAPAAGAALAAAAPVVAAGPAPAPAAPAPERPSRPSVPPTPPAARQDADGAARKSGTIEPPGGQHAPPPPPPAHKQPPTPPPAGAKKPGPQPAAVVAVVTREPSKPSRSKPWYVDLFDEDYLRTLPFLTPQATQAEAEFVLESMNLAAGAQVLDVGCGYGRHAMELAARGFHVVGLDLSTPLLVRGGEESHRRGLTINFVRGDMRELDFENQFDAAYCLFSTFGYFDDETNKKTLGNIQRALKPGGKVLIEILNRDYVIADLPTRVWWEGDGCVVLEEVELNYFSSRIQVNRSVVFDDGRQVEQEISVRAYSLHEVGKLMHLAGFRVLEVSGGYQTRGRFFGNQSRHIIVLAERKESSGT